MRLVLPWALLAASACTRGEPTSTAPTAATSASGDSTPSSTGSGAPTGEASEASGSSETDGGSTAGGSTETATSSAATTNTSTTTTTTTTGADAALADVLSVSVSARGSSFSVEIRSPDLGCSQYADWWEVVTPEGELVYRRILAHSHVDEQPFTRSGGPVEVGADASVIVRAHMNPGGYGGAALRGSVNGGFAVDPSITASFAADLETADPLPSGCAF